MSQPSITTAASSPSSWQVFVDWWRETAKTCTITRRNDITREVAAVAIHRRSRRIPHTAGKEPTWNA